MNWVQAIIVVVVGIPLILFLVYLAARLVTSAYFRSKMAFLRKGFTEKL